MLLLTVPRFFHTLRARVLVPTVRHLIFFRRVAISASARIRTTTLRVLKHLAPFVYSRLRRTYRRLRGSEPFTIDEWYNFGIDRSLRALDKRHRYDVVLVEYVFMSAAFSNFGPNTLKVLDTHDVFTNRQEVYFQKGIRDEFFTTTAREEARGLKRADTVIAIQNDEALQFFQLAATPVATVGHPIMLVPAHLWR